MTPETAESPLATGLARLLDEGRWTLRQKAFMVLAALAVVCDGYGNQLIGFAIPAIMRDWHAPRSEFGPVLALGLIGMALGSVVAGRVGDLAGRRPALERQLWRRPLPTR